MFYSSYFSNIERIKKVNSEMVFIRISRGCVKGYEGMWSLRSLMCSEELLREYKSGLVGVNEYIERYWNENLKNKSCKELVDNLRNKFGDKDICFICYEGKDKFCHRKIVGKWFRDNGYDFREW